MKSSSNIQLKNEDIFDRKQRFKLDFSRISFGFSNNNHQEQQRNIQKQPQNSFSLEKPCNSVNQEHQKPNVISSAKCRKNAPQLINISIFDEFNNNPSVFDMDIASNNTNLCKTTPQFREIHIFSKNYNQLQPSESQLIPGNDKKHPLNESSFLKSISRENLAFRDLSENQISFEEFHEMQKTEQKCRQQVIDNILRDCQTERSLTHLESAIKITPQQISANTKDSKLQILQEQDISFDSFGSPNKYSHRQGLTEVSPIPKEREISQENNTSMSIKYLATPRTARQTMLTKTTSPEYDKLRIPQSQRQQQQQTQYDSNRKQLSKDSSLRELIPPTQSPSNNQEQIDNNFVKLVFQQGSLRIKAIVKKQDSELKSLALNLFNDLVIP